MVNFQRVIKIGFSTALLTFTVFLSTINLYAYKAIEADSDSMKVGLVLSGGGAKGIAHIGVIEAIEEAGIRIDYITGTSMGALVGGLYSIGYTTAQLREIVLANNFNELFLDRRNRVYISNIEKILEERSFLSFPVSNRGISLPTGVISGQNVYTLFSRLTWNLGAENNFDHFPIPFAAIATDLETGEPVVLRSGYLPDAMRASMSIPSVFTPIEVDERLLVDGGIVRNLPVQDAIEMGATYTIAVYVGSKLEDRTRLKTLSSILNQTVSFGIRNNVEEQIALADYYVDVEGLDDISVSDFGKADVLLDIGRTSGRQHLENFREIARWQRQSPPARPGIDSPRSIPINQIIIEGNTVYEDAVIRNLLNFTPGTYLDPDIIEEHISQLYSSQYINNVHYRIERNGDDYILRIKIIENLQNTLRLGIRYENQTKASILLNANFQNLLHPGSLTRFEARLGELLNFRAEHAYFSVTGSRTAFLASLEFITEVVEWYTGSDIVSRYDNTTLRGELSWANYFSTNNLIEVGIRKDFTHFSNKINPDEIRSTDRDHHSLFARYMRDNLNRKSFPVRGRKLLLQGFISDPAFYSPIEFTSSAFNYNIHLPLTRQITWRNSIWLGHSTGRELPWGYWHTPNRFDPYSGYIRFGGADRYQLNSRNVQVVSTGIQFEPFYHWFLGVDGFAGRFLNRWDTNLKQNDIDYSVSVSFGVLTLLGPIELILSHSPYFSFHTELQVGFSF
jgi:NTE family protein